MPVAPASAAALALAGEKTTRGAALNAVANVVVSKVALAVAVVPVVRVIIPAVSVPLMEIVGLDPAAAPAAIAGAEPLEIICTVKVIDLTVKLPEASIFASTVPVESCA